MLILESGTVSFHANNHWTNLRCLILKIYWTFCLDFHNSFNEVKICSWISIPPMSVRTPYWSCNDLCSPDNVKLPQHDMENTLSLSSNTFLQNVCRQRHKLTESCPTTNSSYNNRISFTNLLVRFSIWHTHGQFAQSRFLRSPPTSDWVFWHRTPRHWTWTESK